MFSVVNAAPGFFEELLPLITEELMGEEDTRHFVPQVLYITLYARLRFKIRTL